VNHPTPARATPLTGKHLVFAPTKNKKERDVPVADPVILMLSAHLVRWPARLVTLPMMGPDGKKIAGDLSRHLLFTTYDGSPWFNGPVGRPWVRAWKAAGVPPALQVNGWHVTRHTFASECLSNGLSLAKTAAYLGDSQQVTLTTYSHFMPADEDRARDILNGFWASRDERADALRMPSASAEGE
jgi:integrase